MTGSPTVIDHGAALYFHHGWQGGVTDPERFARQPWDISGHVFGGIVDNPSQLLQEVDATASAILTPDVLQEVVAQVPEDWLEPVPGAETADELRAAYVAALTARLSTRAWLPGGAP